MPELEPTAVLLGLLADIRDRKVLEDEHTCAPYLDLPDDERADVSQMVWVLNQARWAWLPPDTLVWHLTDRGREVLDRGAP